MLILVVSTRSRRFRRRWTGLRDLVSALLGPAVAGVKRCVSSSELAPVAGIDSGPVGARICNAWLVDEVLIRAFAPVLRDLEGAGVAAPGFRDNEWSADPEWLAVSLIDLRGGDQPVRVERSLSEPLMVAELADAVQE